MVQEQGRGGGGPDPRALEPGAGRTSWDRGDGCAEGHSGGMVFAKARKVDAECLCIMLERSAHAPRPVLGHRRGRNVNVVL